MKKTKFCLPVLFVILGLSGLGNLGDWAHAQAATQTSSCLRCHKGIEPISEVPPMSELDCEDCHQGNPDAGSKELAHQDMFANPADFRVVDQVCGLCHQDIVERSKKSLHATMAGMISATRYDFGAQGRETIYATHDVTDMDSDIPKERGAVSELKQLPQYDPSRPDSETNSPADDYLREQCLRCHLWSSGHERRGDWRASGCAACHVIYSDQSLYEGGDQAIDKTRPGRPRFHRITRDRIPVYQCLHCHNRGGRAGVSFIGTMEADPYGSPWSEKAGVKMQKKLHGKYYNHLTPDVHFDRGMACVDCHTEQDLHGDGNIYQKHHYAVEIECTDCHGSASSYSKLKTSWGNPIPRLKKKGGQILLATRDGKERRVPQVKDILEHQESTAGLAMGIGTHLERLECYACHARWAPQCYGCHTQQDLGTRSKDWITTRNPDDPSLAGKKAYRGDTTFKWRESRSYLRWESPALGINSEGKVSPFIPGCQVVFTQIGPEGKVRVLNKVFKTKDGTFGIAHNPVQPHTISRKARTCEDCHSNPKALGLGNGIYQTKANGIDIFFELERFVDESGRQIQATNHEGARPFNREELLRIKRVNVCAGCHGYARDQWEKIKKELAPALDNESHQRRLKEICKKALTPSK